MLIHRFSILILVLVAGIPALAQGPLPGPPSVPSIEHDRVMFLGNAAFGLAGGGQVPDGIVDRVKTALALSDTQVNAVRALLNIRTQANTEALKEMQGKQEALQDLLHQSNPSATDVGNAFLATRAAENKLQAANEKFRTDFTALLSATQRTTLASLEAASEQLEALTLIGLLGGMRGTWTMATPAGALPGPGIGGAVRIERRLVAP